MSKDVIHWAERALDEPYPEQDYSWVRWQYAAALVAAGLASSAVVASAVLLASAARPTADQLILIVSAQAEVVNQEPGSSRAKLQVGPAPKERVAARTKVEPSLDRKAGATVIAPLAKLAGLPPTERKIERGEVSTTAPAPAALQGPATVSPERPPILAKSQTYEAAPKNTERKPADIASGEKLGIQAILDDGIILLSGRKVKTGSPLPNGELLVGTDPAKGMAETDRRVLVVTP